MIAAQYKLPIKREKIKKCIQNYSELTGINVVKYKRLSLSKYHVQKTKNKIVS